MNRKRKKEKYESYWGLMDPFEKVLFIIALVSIGYFIKFIYVL